MKFRYNLAKKTFKGKKVVERGVENLIDEDQRGNHSSGGDPSPLSLDKETITPVELNWSDGFFVQTQRTRITPARMVPSLVFIDKVFYTSLDDFFTLEGFFCKVVSKLHKSITKRLVENQLILH